MVLLTEQKNRILKTRIGNHKIKDRFQGLKAVNKMGCLFYPSDKIKARKWASRWNDVERKNAVYVTYYVKKRTNTYLYTVFIIGEGKRLSVLGQRNVQKTKKRKQRSQNRTKKK